jgi:hypothetical protein
MATTKDQLNRYFAMIDWRVPTRVSQFIRWLHSTAVDVEGTLVDSCQGHCNAGATRYFEVDVTLAALQALYEAQGERVERDHLKHIQPRASETRSKALRTES